jgi:hydroxyethylthiazole kinase-like uncharacterized protein yjeF
MIPGREIHVLDINAEYHGVSTLELMENAGKSVADFISKRYPGKKILLLCGTGNNGGDGFVAARYLCKSHKVSVFLAGIEDKIRTVIAQKNFLRLKNTDITICDMSSVDQLDQLITDHFIIVDALLGIGLSGELREPYVSIVQKLNKISGKAIVSVDVPAGLGTKQMIKPTHTITFHDIKEGMNERTCGVIHIVDIGIPEEAYTHVGPGELAIYYPRPKATSHKGDNGSVLVIGGGPYIGAPALAGLAALRAGVDLVFIATPQRSTHAIEAMSPDLIVKELHADVLTPGDLSVIRELLQRVSSVVIGPGLGKAKETEEAILKIVELVTSKKKPLVIDADAMAPVGKKLDLIMNTQTVVTPHSREFTELSGIHLSENLLIRRDTVELWTNEHNITTLLKGPTDIISNGEYTKFNTIHNPAMTVGGTGDVLAGITGALVAKGILPFNAARIAAFINGAAGNIAFNQRSYGLIASDIIQEIPTVLKNYL